MVVNGVLDIRRKSNITASVLHATLSNFFSSGTGSAFSFLYDVRTTYDSLANRFVVLAIQDGTLTGEDQKILSIAVSRTSDPEQGWNFLTTDALFSFGGSSR